MSDLENMFKLNSKFIARWALPNEGIPLFLTWEGNLVFDSIEVLLPESFVIRNYYNIEKKDLFPNRIQLYELKREGYVGFVFTSPNVEQTSEQIQVTLNFLKGGAIVHQEVFVTRIIRPKIELEVPDKIEILPTEATKVNIKLKYTGYGNTYCKIMVSDDASKLVFDVKDSRDLFIVMANCHSFKEFMKRNQISEEDFLGSKVPEDQYDYRELLLATSQLGEFTAEAFFDTVSRTLENKKLMEILEKSIELTKDVSTSFFRSIIEFVEKRPVEGVFLSTTRIEPIELEEGTRALYVCIGYVDDFGNYYSQIKSIRIVLKKKQTITFGSKWAEQAGKWEWLKKE